MKTLTEQIKEVDLSNFKILEVSKTEKFIFIKAIKECPVYFAFYEHFIVCSGDYGEWIFDCSWQTKKTVNLNPFYLLGKLSRDCRKTYFDNSQVEEDFQNAKEDFYDSYNIEEDYDEEIKNELRDLFDDFQEALTWADEYRHISVVDEYTDQISELLDIESDCETWTAFYEAGLATRPHIIVNIAMIQKLIEMNVLTEDLSTNE